MGIRASGVRRPILVGFAAETGSFDRVAEKLRSKGVDMLVSNDVSEPGSGFGTDTNKVTMYSTDAPPEQLPLRAVFGQEQHFPPGRLPLLRNKASQLLLQRLRALRPCRPVAGQALALTARLGHLQLAGRPGQRVLDAAQERRR